MEPKWQVKINNSPSVLSAQMNIPDNYIPTANCSTLELISTNAFINQRREEIFWKDVCEMAKEDPYLQELINHVKLHYYLKKEHNGEK